MDCVSDPLKVKLKHVLNEADLVCPEPLVNDMLSLGTLSATRWTIRANCVGKFIAAYGKVVRACLKMSEKKDLAGAKARGYADKLMRFETYFDFNLLYKILRQFDITYNSLQKVEITVIEGGEHIARLKSAIMS